MPLSNTKFGGTEAIKREHLLQLKRDLKSAKLLPKELNLSVKKLLDNHKLEEKMNEIRRCKICTGYKSYNRKLNKFICRRCN